MYQRLILVFCCIFGGLASHAQSGVIQATPTLEDRFPKRIGNLRFSETTLHLGDVYTNEVRTDSILLYNNSSAAMDISLEKNPPGHVQVKISPMHLDPSAEGLISISYDASKAGEYGFTFERMMLKTNDPLQVYKNVNLTATIKEYFPPVAEGDTMPLQKVRVSESTFNFGRIQQGQKARHEFMLYNDGAKELIVHQAKSDCGCLKSTFSKTTLSPGDSCSFAVEFDSFGKDGPVNKSMSVFINDPSQPELRFNVEGDVWK